MKNFDNSLIKIWGRLNSINVQKVLWTCAELNIDYERIDAGGDFGIVNASHYLAINPNKLVPAIKDKGVYLWESNTIVRYLAAEYGAGAIWPASAINRARSDCWMDWQSTTLWPAMRPIFHQLVRVPPEARDHNQILEATASCSRLLVILDQELYGKLFIIDHHLTIGDIALGVAIYRWMQLPIERPSFKSLENWYFRLCEREAFRKIVMQPLT